MRTLAAAAVGLLLLGTTAALADDIQTDYNHSMDFSKYHTFMWIKQPKTDNPIMSQRIVDDVNAQLEAKGLRLVASNADLGIAANTATREQHTLQTFYDGFPGWGWYRWGGYWGPATTTVETYEVGTLLVDVFDSQMKQVVWWGSATDVVSDKPEKNAKRLEESVAKMFKHFPSHNEERESN